jgi:CheY-like chemotaxis protein
MGDAAVRWWGLGDKEMERRKRILVVEDEELVSAVISDALTEDGFDVQVYSNAGDALAYLKSGNPVDVLFTDIDLPGGMDGGYLASRARELNPELPVVYASGKPFGLRHVAQVPGSIFLQKPYDLEQACLLVARISAIGH